jgi:transglutaminase-like putative cysteine protease/preprotein translocase subunit SecG
MGKIAFINPNPKSEQKEGEYYKLGFNREDLLKYGVLVTIGQYQTFNFEISYDLENPNSSPAYTKIALPPDTANQTVYYSILEPEPANVEFDKDGNWLAIYNLKPKQKLTIKAKGVANIFSKPIRKLSVPFDNPKEYLKETKYWQKENEKIKSLANTLKTPENIYKYVVSSLNYDYSELTKPSLRKGALKTLENPDNAVCTDFSDLFIAIARSAGIPARQINGYAYSDDPKLKELSKNMDSLHSWAEYFDSEKNEWIMVDPTWENTSGGLDYFNKFDMSHFAFVIHGIEDDSPLTPGSYKPENDKKRQVFISLGEDEFINHPEYFAISEIKPRKIFSFINNKVEVEFVNQSGFAFYDKELFVESEESAYPSSKKIGFLPPYSRFNFSFLLKPKEQLRDYQTSLNFSLGSSKIENSVLINSLLVRLIMVLGGLFSAIIILLLRNLKKRSCNDKAANDTVLIENHNNESKT